MASTRAIEIAPDVFIVDAALRETFIRASGPGGQNVNKVATAVQLAADMRVAARACPALDAGVIARLRRIAGRRMTADGRLVIEASRFRTRERNREDAVARLADLVARALVKPKPRTRTKPGRTQRAKRLDEKKRRGAVKSLRRRPGRERGKGSDD